jgi:hypothetical protein
VLAKGRETSGMGNLKKELENCESIFGTEGKKNRTGLRQYRRKVRWHRNENYKNEIGNG